MKKITVEFPIDYDTEQALCIPLGRMILCKGSIVRMILTPEGFKLYISKHNKDANDVIIHECLDEMELVIFKKTEPTTNARERSTKEGTTTT